MRDQDLFLPRLMVRDHSCSEELGVEQKQQERLRCHRQEFGKEPLRALVMSSRLIRRLLVETGAKPA